MGQEQQSLSLRSAGVHHATGESGGFDQPQRGGGGIEHRGAEHPEARAMAPAILHS